MATKLRGASDYTIGLDLGTGSVGWAVVDSNGELCRFKGQPTWGSRLFDSADTAAKTRGHRSQRRRYDRRKRRLWRLQEWVKPDMKAVDENFFRKMEESFKHGEDRSFTDTYDSFLSSEERQKYKTIYHVRRELVNNPAQADIRLVYLALHHILKYRGHFLEESENLKAANADSHSSVENLCEVLVDWQARRNAGEVIFSDENKSDIASHIEDKTRRRGERRDNVTNVFVQAGFAKDVAKILSGAVFGYETAFSKLLDVEEGSDTKFSLSNSDKVDEFISKHLPADDEDFFNALTGAYNAYVLAGILEGSLGLSGSMVKSYEQHKEELKELKGLVREFLPHKYDEFFRGDVEENGEYVKKGHGKKKASAGYTAYILGSLNRDAFYDELKKLFKGVDLGDKQGQWDALLEGKIKDETYLLKQRSSDNGAIPHQLHLEEMSIILENQGRYYPTLREHKTDIENLLKFRLPYYAGPLGTEKNPMRPEPFGWAKRKPDKEHEPIISMETFEEIIDVDQAAEDFIERLTGECTYWYGKKTLPRNSLLYEEFTVRNELNKCRLIIEGEKGMPRALSPEVADDIFNNVFKKRRRVKASDVLDYLKQNNHYDAVELIGTQKENEFASALNAYHDYKKILGRDIVSDDDVAMVEDLIRWATIFEDKKIRKRTIKTAYGHVLNDEQLKAVVKKHYTGWGKLSREFLVDLRAQYEEQHFSIMDVLRNSRAERPMNLMEILADKRFNFGELLDTENCEYQKDMNDLRLEEIPGSPAIKRSIRQAVAIVDEITAIAKHMPAKICVEMAREEEGETAGSRTSSREKQIKDFLDAIKKDKNLSADVKNDAEAVKKQLASNKDRLYNKKMYLYFLQLGKCMYTGDALDISRLHEYDIEHIVPRALIKDDSIDNTILVKSKENRGKSDTYPLPDALRNRNWARWNELKNADLLTERKFRSLTRNQLRDGELKGFISRQLVETRQITKHVVNVLTGRYADTAIETVKAELGHNIRERYGLYKSRELNDYHHAHDAFLATQISRFMEIRFPSLAKDLEYSSHSFRADKFKAMLDKQSGSKNPSGLIVWAFGQDETYVNKETGEIWECNAELTRIRSCLAWKQCFISRKVEQLTGEFWNATIISRWAAGDKKVPPVPLKTAGRYLDPAKYGGYDSVNSAYYLAIEYEQGKKRVRKLVGVPVNVSYGLRSQQDIEDYVVKTYVNGRLLRGPIYKYQKIRWDGAEYYLVAPTEVINARQLCIPQRFHEFVSLKTAKDFNDDEARRFNEGFEELYKTLVEKMEKDYPRYSSLVDKLKNEDIRHDALYMVKDGNKTCAATDEEQREQKLLLVKEMLKVMHSSSERGIAVGVYKNDSAGRLNGCNIFNGKPIEFIYTSVTGMFENEYRL